MRPYYLIPLLLNSGCCTLQLDNDYCAKVERSSSTTYVTDFKWHPTYQLASTREEAIQLMLKRSNLFPKECINGIKYLKGGETEGGWGWAEFECM